MSQEDQTFRARPRFRQEVELPQNEVKDRILQALEEQRDMWNGKIVDNHVILKVPVVDMHYWSPQLTLELEEHEGNTLIRGLFGPKPGVWTMFVFFYSAIGFLTTMGLIFGLSQWMLKMEPYGLWSVPVGSLLLIGLFIISKVGQGLGREQMEHLNGLLQSAIYAKEDT